MERIYLDHNATSPMREEVRELLFATVERVEGNPSSVHASGREARQLLDEARERVAAALGVHEDEVIFTSGGTESNNLAIAGALRAPGARPGLVTTAIEHSSVLAVARSLESSGQPLVHIAVDEHGRPDQDILLDCVQTGPCGLVSVMAANNEVGSLSDLEGIGAALAEVAGTERPLFHTDAVQALGRIPLNLDRWGVDLATFSAHKVGGPVGMGVLVRREGVPLSGLLLGGEQEAGLRAGTENVPAIVAGSRAIELAVEEQPSFARHCRELCLLFYRQVRDVLPDARLMGPPIDAADRSPNTINLSLPNVDGHVLVTRLDLAGLSVSAGSACASGSLEPSHVLIAMGLSPERARAGLRFSFGRSTTQADIHNAVGILRKTLSQPS